MLSSVCFGDDSESGGPIIMLNSRTAIQSDLGESSQKSYEV